MHTPVSPSSFQSQVSGPQLPCAHRYVWVELSVIIPQGGRCMTVGAMTAQMCLSKAVRWSLHGQCQMLLCRHRFLDRDVSSQISKPPLCESVLLAATFPTSVCMFLVVRLHLWEESSQGRQKQLLQNPGSGPKRPTDQQPGANGPFWLFLAPHRAQSGVTKFSLTLHLPPGGP